MQRVVPGTGNGRRNVPRRDDAYLVVREELSESTLFAARFREAAGRSLLLPRRRPGSRSPLWAQRQKAHALLSVASRFPAFPLILEAYRECLVEDFDVEALVGVLRDIEKKKIRAVTLDAARPTPFASALLFGYVATVMYDDDAPVAASPRPASTVLLQRSPRHTPSAHSRPLPHSESAAQRLLQALTPMTSSQAGATPKMQANNNPRGYQ